jgi:hypothetical protein
MRDCGFRNLNSFYKYKSVNTWASTFNNLVFTLDHLLERPQGKKLTIIDTKVITKGTQSDHLPVCLILKVCAKRRAQGKRARPKPRLKRTSPTSSIYYDPIEKAGKNRHGFHTFVANVLQKKAYYAGLARTIAEAAKETAGVEKKMRQDWFSKNKKD